MKAQLYVAWGPSRIAPCAVGADSWSAAQVGALLQSRTKGLADSLKSKGFSAGKCKGARVWKGTRSKVAQDGGATIGASDGQQKMSIIKFPTHLISTLELSEALDWNHADLMKDACSVAQVTEMPPEWFRPATYRDENGAIQNSYNMTSSGLMMLLWNCSGPRELQRNCRVAMLAIMVVRAGSREAAEENYAKAISAAGFKPHRRFAPSQARIEMDGDAGTAPADPT
jgi:hypothetical protein